MAAFEILMLRFYKYFTNLNKDVTEKIFGTTLDGNVIILSSADWRNKRNTRVDEVSEVLTSRRPALQ